MIYLIVLLLFLFLIRFRKVRIKWRTFLEKGFVPNNDRFGVYCYTGKQGRGKTYSLVEFVDTLTEKDTLYYNMESLDTSKLKCNCHYFEGLEGLLALNDLHNIYIVYDEIFTAVTKNMKMEKRILFFLSQMRKRKVIFLTSAQEWLELDMTWRRYCRFQIECHMYSPLGIVGILKKVFYDAEQMKWSNEENNYVAPEIETTYSKCRLRISEMYDTYQIVDIVG